MTVWATRADQVDLRGPNPHDLARSPRTAAPAEHLRGRAVPGRPIAARNRGADRPVVLGSAANSGHSRRTPVACGCGRAAPGARTYRFGLTLQGLPAPLTRSRHNLDRHPTYVLATHLRCPRPWIPEVPRVPEVLEAKAGSSLHRVGHEG